MILGKFRYLFQNIVIFLYMKLNLDNKRCLKLEDQDSRHRRMRFPVQPYLDMDNVETTRMSLSVQHTFVFLLIDVSMFKCVILTAHTKSSFVINTKNLTKFLENGLV